MLLRLPPSEMAEEAFCLYLKGSGLLTLKQDFCHQKNKSGMLGEGDVQMIIEYSM